MLLSGTILDAAFLCQPIKKRHPRVLLAGTEFRRQGVNENRIIVSKN